jgi:hypothetical protein
MTVDDIKLTVKDYALGKVTDREIPILQRYFIKKYCSWLPMRAIAEATGGKEHTRVIDAIKAVQRKQSLFNISHAINFILDAKLKKQPINYHSVRLFFDNKEKKLPKCKL